MGVPKSIPETVVTATYLAHGAIYEPGLMHIHAKGPSESIEGGDAVINLPNLAPAANSIKITTGECDLEDYGYGKVRIAWNSSTPPQPETVSLHIHLPGGAKQYDLLTQVTASQERDCMVHLSVPLNGEIIRGTTTEIEIQSATLTSGRRALDSEGNFIGVWKYTINFVPNGAS